MLYRKLDQDGDYQIGIQIRNTPETVGQAISTRLKLWAGEYFLDVTEGTPYLQDILGKFGNYDLEIQSRILDTPGVSSIENYTSAVNNRQLSVDCIVNTIYGSLQIQV